MKQTELFLFDKAVNIDEDVAKFKNREIKAKEIFTIREIDKKIAYAFIKQYHYLKDAKFFAKYSYGLYIDNVLVGCSTFSNEKLVWFT